MAQNTIAKNHLPIVMCLQVDRTPFAGGHLSSKRGAEAAADATRECRRRAL
jgi:hypothetical protein